MLELKKAILWIRAGSNILSIILSNFITSGATDLVATNWAATQSEAKMAKLTEKEDIEAYLTTFERIMGAYNIAKEQWVFTSRRTWPSRVHGPPDGRR